MFTTESNLQVLSAANTLYCDGTFSVCPHLLFIIHSFSHGKQFLLVYFLLNKTQETYNMAFLLLKENCQNYRITLDPSEVKTDFELALLQSIRISFPNASFRGCYYHFSQAIWRKVQSIGLQQEYQTQGSEVKKFFRRVIALPFVPGDMFAWLGLA